MCDQDGQVVVEMEEASREPDCATAAKNSIESDISSRLCTTCSGSGRTSRFLDHTVTYDSASAKIKERKLLKRDDFVD